MFPDSLELCGDCGVIRLVVDKGFAMIRSLVRTVSMLPFALTALMMAPPGAAAQDGAPAGRLTCAVGPGLGLVVTSKRPMDCRFTPRRGPVQRYVGTVRSFGLDIGPIRRGTMSWRVYGPYARAPLGALAGGYVGAGAGGAAAGIGASGNLLIGGAGDEVTLQPLSLQSRRGFNVAVGVTGLDLVLSRPRARR